MKDRLVRLSTTTVHRADRRIEGGWAVYPNALLFRAGSYPDKGLTVSPEDLARAVARFRPVGGNIEHTDFLQNRAVIVRRIWVDAADPALLRGELAVPLGLDDLLEGDERKLSCEWDRKRKELVGMALTTAPRVPEAALVAAYAAFAKTRHDTYHGQFSLQDIHDAAARSGAVCSPPATFVAKHEAVAFQALHDMTVEHGATCTAVGPAPFKGARHNQTDQADLQQIHDLSNRQGAACAPASMGHTPRRGAGRMPSFTQFKQWFALGRDGRELARAAGAELPEEAEFAVVEDAERTAREQAHQDEIAKLSAKRSEAEAELQAARQEAIKARAERMQAEGAGFADGLILAGQLFPAEREGLIALFSQAAQDDAAHGTATFSGGESRVGQVKKLYGDRPKMALTKEGLDPDQQVKVLLNGGQGGEPQAVDPALPTPEGRAPSEDRLKYLRSVAGIPAK